MPSYSSPNELVYHEDQSMGYSNQQPLTYYNQRYPSENGAYVNYNQSYVQYPTDYIEQGPANYVEQAPANYVEQAPVIITLKDKDNWTKFAAQINEMMVFALGREIFPKLSFEVIGLNENFSYIVSLKLIRTSTNLMKYNHKTSTGWSEERVSKGVSADRESNEIYMKAQTGNDLMKNGMNWKSAKIFNVADPKKSKTKPSQTMLETMLKVQSHHQYTPFVTIYDAVSHQIVASASFKETSFIVVTKYKNKDIANMKSMENKFCRNDIQKKVVKKSQEASLASSMSPPTASSIPPAQQMNAEVVLPSSASPSSASTSSSPPPEPSPINMQASTVYSSNICHSGFGSNVLPDSYVECNNAQSPSNYIHVESELNYENARPLFEDNFVPRSPLLQCFTEHAQNSEYDYTNCHEYNIDHQAINYNNQ